VGGGGREVEGGGGGGGGGLGGGWGGCVGGAGGGGGGALTRRALRYHNGLLAVVDIRAIIISPVALERASLQGHRAGMHTTITCNVNGTSRVASVVVNEGGHNDVDVE